jgi:monoamine oxidase
MARTPLFHWLGLQVRSALAQNAAIAEKTSASTDSSWIQKPLTRRQFLKGLAVTTGALALSPALQSLAAMPRFPKNEPVLIVGAGLGGLVTAYRLMKKGIPCELYEANTRAGGRVFSKRHFNRENMFVELGGELVDTDHDDIIALCQELNVPLEAFAPFDKDLTPTIYFSGGKIHTETEVIAAFKPLAETLIQDIQLCFPDGEVAVPTYQEPYKAQWLDKLSLEDYLNQQTHIEPWLIRLIKVAYTGEYGLDPESQSALNLLILIGTDTKDGFRMFGASDEAMRIKGGNSSLVEALIKALEGKVSIHFRHVLDHIEDREHTLKLTFQTGKNAIEKTPARAVLALPFSILRDVDGIDELALSTVKKQAITQWGYGTNSKQMIGFRSRFWRKANGPVPANTGEVYSDLPSQCYWETSRLQPGRAGILTNFLGGEAGKNATINQWKTALAELSNLYPDITTQPDGNRAFFNWHENPWTLGSYTCPRPGQYTSIVGAAGEPELQDRLFFAGEHCSVDWAGYMNGAVQSGNQASEKILTALAQHAVQKAVALPV